MSVQISTFIKLYTKAIIEGYAAVFAGAGLSIPSGYVSWRELLRPFAEEIELTIDKEHDYLAVAQYYCNKHGNRGSINNSILNAFTSSTASNENIEILTRLSISTYWTTNYDHLIEDGLKANNRKPDIKLTEKSLANNIYDSDAIVYKMHGDVNQPDEAVLIKDDYETYELKRGLFSTVLRGHLVSKTFLFVGFSFEDPNLGSILGRIKALLGADVRDHYCFWEMVRQKHGESVDDFGYRKAKQGLVVDDLKRYGIQAVLLDSYAQIPSILKEIERRCNLQNVFLSGSISSDEDKWTINAASVFTRDLAQQLVYNGKRITSGYGLGIGSAVITGVLNAVKERMYSHFDEFIKLYPFPQPKDGDDFQSLWHEYREEMLKNCGIAVFLFGNKLDKDGNVKIANGMIDEYRIAQNRGARIIPVASTGGAAKWIYDEMSSDVAQYPYLADLWDTLKTIDNPVCLAELIKKVIECNI